VKRSQALASLIALQLLGILLLTQTWYSISMSPEGHTVTLGEYAGTDANPSAMPALLFVAVALFVIAFTTGLARIVTLSAALVATALNLAFLAMATFSKDISALDATLDRLTGIAKTHGIADLSITQTPWAFVWLAAQALFCVLLLACLLWQRSWSKAASKSSAAKPSVNSKSKAKTPKSAIDLWDEQRD
jgi:hypothetical protein